MRELSEAEKRFIEDRLEFQDEVIVSEEFKESNPDIVKKKAPYKRKKVPAYKNPVHWLVAILIAPVLFAALFALLITQMNSVFGADTINTIANSGGSGTVDSLGKEWGITWLPEAIAIYQNRWLIVGLIFTFFFTLAIIVILFNFFMDRAKKSRAEKQSTKKTDAHMNSENGTETTIEDEEDTDGK